MFVSLLSCASSQRGACCQSRGLHGPRGGNLPLSNSTTWSNQAWISPLFITPDTHFNLITQLQAFLLPLDLSHYLSFSHSPLISSLLDPLLPLSCLLPYPCYFSFLDSDINLIHCSPLLFNTTVCHNQTHISVFLFAGLSGISFLS